MNKHHTKTRTNTKFHTFASVENISMSAGKVFICKVNSQDMDWKNKAIEILRATLTPIPHELSELDWKSGLSPKTDRIAQHI